MTGCNVRHRVRNLKNEPFFTRSVGEQGERNKNSAASHAQRFPKVRSLVVPRHDNGLNPRPLRNVTREHNPRVTERRVDMTSELRHQFPYICVYARVMYNPKLAR